MDLSNINFFAVIVATLSTFVVGWLWYGPLFGKAWMSAVGFTEEQLQQGNMAKIFGLAFIFEFIMAFNLAMFFYGGGGGGSIITTWTGAFYGFLTGFGWIFFAIAVTSLYEQRSWKYVLINGGYWTISLTVMGLILGLWK
ncbi:MAG TPA: DUF1761 domain-containing protein [Balneolaceae bacterium]|nr:DUF1761 domain-containing protein [Balneolaceae bacterium]